MGDDTSVEVRVTRRRAAPKGRGRSPGGDCLPRVPGTLLGAGRMVLVPGLPWRFEMKLEGQAEDACDMASNVLSPMEQVARAPVNSRRT